jgi:penicillin-binding protein 1A
MYTLFRSLIKAGVSLAVVGILAFVALLAVLNANLPSVEALKDTKFQVPLRIYTHDGKLIGEYGEKRTIPTTLEATPPLVIKAILATEDHRFYEHSGVDLRGLSRAALHLALTGNKGQGGGTITMQLARNIFLSPQKSYIRKLNEILLALKIEREFTKSEILELYLNKIYFGKRAYGIAAAAEVYYGKTLDKLTLPEIAMLAGLPQAPSAVNPINDPDSARVRRHHVLERMYYYGDITEAQFKAATRAPVATSYHGPIVEVSAPYVAEEVRKELASKMGDELYTSGYRVYTTLSSRLQTAANQALYRNLLAYDQRHGYRGPEDHFSEGSQRDWQQLLDQMSDVGGLKPAVVIGHEGEDVKILLANGHKLTVSSNHHLRQGDVIRLDDQGTPHIAEIPKVEGALVAVSPKDGAVLAMVGGFDYAVSSFNRATQAARSPGSNFKPFIYSAALAKGYTPASIINDAPLVVEDPSQEGGLWRPQNTERDFNGPIRLRVALSKSINVASIRLLQSIGTEYAVNYVSRFGFLADTLPKTLSLALGTNTATPIQMARSYAAFANGGYRVSPFLIDHIEEGDDNTVTYQAKPPTACGSCGEGIAQAPAIITPQNAYLMTNILQDTIRSGTAMAAQSLGRHDLAGKTGTSQDQRDAWFSGYNGDLVATAWVGFDDQKSVGEYGNGAALPMWIDFMRSALKGAPESAWPPPLGIETVNIDPQTGLLARAGQSNAIPEVFEQTSVPTQQAPDSISVNADNSNGKSGENNNLQIPEQLF